MVDLSLDLNELHSGQPTYRDLLVVDGDLTLTSDSDPNGTNPVLQDILQRLRFFLGEWFLDNTQGIPYYQQILVKGANQKSVDAIFQNVILGTPGVLQLSSYSANSNSNRRTLSVQFSCLTTSGPVSYTGVIAPVNGGQT